MTSVASVLLLYMCPIMCRYCYCNVLWETSLATDTDTLIHSMWFTSCHVVVM